VDGLTTARTSLFPILRRVILLVAFVAATMVVLLQPAPQARSYPTTPIKELIGANVVVNNRPSDIAQVAAWVRDYHKWYWYEGTPDANCWECAWQNVGTFYRALAGVGVKVMPVVEFAPAWASSNGQITGIPDAAAHADYMGDLAAYFGSTIAAVENYNEPNQTWRQPLFPASQFGAMTATDYQAVKARSPGTRFVLGGLAGPDTTYLSAMNQSAGGAYDVVNFHWYALGDTTTGGKNPEGGSLLDHVGWVRDWRNANAPGKPIWMTEFGWDTFAPGSSRVYAPEASAANYLLRAIFIMQSRDVEKAFVYMYRDPVSSGSALATQYNSAGLVVNSAESDGRKKMGWYYLATARNVLGNYVLDRVVADGPNIYHYEYAEPGTSNLAAVLWARNGDRDNGYTTPYAGPAGTLVVPTDGSTTGTATVTDGNLVLSERPVFVLFNDASRPTPTATATGTPSPDPSLSPTPTPSPSATSTPTATPTASATPTPSDTPTPSHTPTPSDTPTATSTPVVPQLFEPGAPVGEAIPYVPTLRPVYTWSEVEGADTYCIQVSNNASFTSLRSNNIVTDPTFTVSTSNLPRQQFWWRVKAARQCNTIAAWSEVYTFTTVATAATASRTPTITLTPTASAVVTATAPLPSTPTLTPVSTPPPPTPSPLPGASLLTNGGFEVNSNGDGVPDGWSVTPANWSHLVSASSEEQAEGAVSLRASGSGGQSYTVSQELPVSPGQTYNLSGALNIPSTSGAFQAQVQLYVLTKYKGPVSTTVVSSHTAGTGGWVPINGTVQIPSNGGLLRVQLKVSNMHADVHLDGLSLTRS
jgi:hypothetical protein